ncbi:hypothetical protein G436_3645 [Leptospira interrogans serovar Hardjo str. Norma]|uniref:Uncharacterized protein n=1 Tax=Leptospira interrogans serovar Hardjo str. Norma TaxID=1279460 RepID=A0A0M4NB42_LEPIR|nr:hypothetical protein G436_3645 [Leptospira interrogans serovar Hardjo str. Norma]
MLKNSIVEIDKTASINRFHTAETNGKFIRVVEKFHNNN